MQDWLTFVHNKNMLSKICSSLLVIAILQIVQLELAGIIVVIVTEAYGVSDDEGLILYGGFKIHNHQ